TPESAIAVRRDERDRVDARARNDLDHDLHGPCGQPAKAPLLPGRDDATDRLVVGDRGAGPGEGEPPSRALGTTRDRPRGRRAAAGAEGRAEPSQSKDTRRADLRP